MQRKKIIAVALVALAALTLAGCPKKNPQASRDAGRNATDEQEQISTVFGLLTDSQQIPVFDFSQERQTVIEAETIRATGVIGTTMFFLEGIGLIQWCPSAGAPVPSTYQLSPETQYVDIPNDRTRDRFPLEQGEPTGVYVGESTGTWVVCLHDNGSKFGVYWEGPVGSTIGIVEGLDPALRVKVDEVTFEFMTSEGTDDEGG